MIWPHVTKSNPCGICGKPDWCQIGDFGWRCYRVESPRPFASGGWFHVFHSEAKPPAEKPKFAPPPQINATKLLAEWQAATSRSVLQSLADILSVSVASLVCLGACYAPPHRAWAFPMCDGYGNPIGIRLRADDGRKWAVRGSRQGIFLPEMDPQKTIYVCEGPTDTAAALTLGLYAAGRPSCLCGGIEIKAACRRLGVRRAVIISDNDIPGLRGAEKIAAELKLPSAVYVPPAKDLREFVCLGGSRALIESSLHNTIWRTK